MGVHRLQIAQAVHTGIAVVCRVEHERGRGGVEGGLHNVVQRGGAICAQAPVCTPKALQYCQGNQRGISQAVPLLQLKDIYAKLG